MNYFTNAVHYCKEKEGKKIIEVTVECKDGLARISVFNTGDPIPEEAVPRLWEKFYKVDKARTREYGGSRSRTFHSKSHYGVHESEIWW